MTPNQKLAPAFSAPAAADIPQLIKVLALRPSKTNPRKTFDPAFIAEMAQSMRQDGVLTALLVRPTVQREFGTDAFEIVSGEQRYRAAKEAGLPHVPALVRDLTDDQVMGIQLVENLKRKDLTALEEADGLNHLVRTGVKVEQVAERIGRSPEYVYDRLRLMSLVAEVRELLLNKRIELGHAILLAALTPDDQRRAIREQGGGLWTSQRSMWVPDSLRTKETDEEADAREARSDDSYKAVSVKELKLWIDDRVKFRVDAPHNLQLFPATVAAVQQAEESKTKVIHITCEHQVHPDAKDAQGPRVYSAVAWKRADGKGKSKTCAHSALGIIDVGPMRGQALMVCVDRKNCTVHFGDVIKERKRREQEIVASGATGDERAKLAKSRDEDARRKAEEAHAAFMKCLPAIRLAIAQQIAALPIANAQSLIVAELDATCNPGVRQAVQKLLPQGKTLEGWVRYVAAACVLREIMDDGWARLDDAVSAGKSLGLDVNKIITARSAPRVEKCRVCECTAEQRCAVKIDGRRDYCHQVETPDKKTLLYLCSACAARTGAKASTKSKAKK